MTIAKRLVLLLAVPLLVLAGLGVFTWSQLTTIETRSRFVAELQVPSLAALGNISRAFAELRVHLRNHVLATSEAERETRVGDPLTVDGRRIGEVVARAPPLDGGGDRVLAALDLPYANPGLTCELDGAPVVTRSAPFVTNRSLFVNPQRHAWATRDEIELPPELRWPTTGPS